MTDIPNIDNELVLKKLDIVISMDKILWEQAGNASKGQKSQSANTILISHYHLWCKTSLAQFQNQVQVGCFKDHKEHPKVLFIQKSFSDVIEKLEKAANDGGIDLTKILNKNVV